MDLLQEDGCFDEWSGMWRKLGSAHHIKSCLDPRRGSAYRSCPSHFAPDLVLLICPCEILEINSPQRDLNHRFVLFGTEEHVNRAFCNGGESDELFLRLITPSPTP